MAAVSELLSQPGTSDFGAPEDLGPLFPPGVEFRRETWWRLRADALRRWQGILGKPEPEEIPAGSERTRCAELPYCLAEEYLLPTSPGSRQRVILLRPREGSGARLPAAIVPFYNPEAMVGYDLDTHLLQDAPTIHFGRHLVQQGYLVLCAQAFPYNTVPDPGTGVTFDRWRAAARKLLAQHPRWTGMGRLIRDTRIATDFLLAQPGVDLERVVIMGHSLGGKMAFYNGCLDRRIRAIVASDFGIGFRSTNWHDPWYLGPQVQRPSLPGRHHELLAAACPAAFLLIAGQYDGPASWQYLNAARPVYELYGRGQALGMLDHASGHRPPEQAMQTAYAWLAEQFGLPQRPVCI
jgi:predicted esterase